MNCANCGKEIRPCSKNILYGNTYRHVAHWRSTCIFAKYDVKDKIDWTDTEWCDEKGIPYVASLTKGEVSTDSFSEFHFVLPKTKIDLNLAPWDRV
jgi:hypothetical protein